MAYDRYDTRRDRPGYGNDYDRARTTTIAAFSNAQETKSPPGSATTTQTAAAAKTNG